ncbi:MAG: hypothetical protein AAF517_07530 [Planctomycetota bacterium]
MNGKVVTIGLGAIALSVGLWVLIQFSGGDTNPPSVEPLEIPANAVFLPIATQPASKRVLTNAEKQQLRRDLKLPQTELFRQVSKELKKSDDDAGVLDLWRATLSATQSEEVKSSAKRASQALESIDNEELAKELGITVTVTTERRPLK